MPRLRHALYRRIQRQWAKHYFPNATLPAHDVNCPECGLHTHLPKLRQGQSAECPRCHHHLVSIEPEPYPIVLACAIAALILMLLVYSQSFVRVMMTGMYANLTLPEMMITLIGSGKWSFLGIVLTLLTFGTPVVFLLSCIYVYSALIFERNVRYLLGAARLLTRLQEWIMVDVFFVSMLVAYIKLSAVASVKFGSAFWLMPVLALLLLRTAVATPSHWVYYQIRRAKHQAFFQAAPDTLCCKRCLFYRPTSETFCGVCGSELFHRRPSSLKVSACFLLAAMILYLPANFLTIMISTNPIEKEISTIMSGIIFMWNNGDRFIASVIFSASIAVPTLKIISMLMLLYSAAVRPLLPIHALSVQYRITERVGRWSMIDIFVIIIMMSIFHTNIARVTPGPAAIYFCLVVILTMLSAHFFDVRILWDKAGENSPDRQPENALAEASIPSDNNGSNESPIRQPETP